MQKEEFFSILDKHFEKLSIDDKIKSLETIKKDNFIEEYLNITKKGYTLCPHCKKYYKDNEKLERSTEVKTVKEFVYYGGGYGDEYRQFDLTYRYFYVRCPKCSNLIVENREYIEGLEKINEKTKSSFFKRRKNK